MRLSRNDERCGGGVWRRFAAGVSEAVIASIAVILMSTEPIDNVQACTTRAGA